jgi:O-acetylhomoserine/O-acetylserine sulfhydrylase-like pyridoxal-dependent enzyme
MKLPTRLLQRAPDSLAGVQPLTLPIYETTTFVFDSAAEVCEYNEGRGSKYLYSRYENPTVVAVERTLASLEGAEAAILLSSGQAASTTALLALVSAGDEVV